MIPDKHHPEIARCRKSIAKTLRWMRSVDRQMAAIMWKGIRDSRQRLDDLAAQIYPLPWHMAASKYLHYTEDPLEFRWIYEQKFPPPSAAELAGEAAYATDGPSRPPKWVTDPIVIEDYRRGYARASARDAARHEREIGKL